MLPAGGGFAARIASFEVGALDQEHQLPPVLALLHVDLHPLVVLGVHHLNNLALRAAQDRLL